MCSEHVTWNTPSNSAQKKPATLPFSSLGAREDRTRWPGEYTQVLSPSEQQCEGATGAGWTATWTLLLGQDSQSSPHSPTGFQDLLTSLAKVRPRPRPQLMLAMGFFGPHRILATG